MPRRSFSSASAYKFGFNGKENDNDVKCLGNQQDYGMRIYDARVGRFLSVDPLVAEYPWYTPYQFTGNSPIANIDLDGAEPKPANTGAYEGQSATTSERVFRAKGSYVVSKTWYWHSGGMINGRQANRETNAIETTYTQAGWYSSEDYAKVLGSTYAAKTLIHDLHFRNPSNLSTYDEGKRDLQQFIKSEGLNENFAKHLISGGEANKMQADYRASGHTYASAFNVEDILGLGVLFKQGLKYLGSLTGSSVKFYRAMSFAEYEKLIENGGLTYLEGKQLFVSTRSAYSKSYLSKPGYDLVVEFKMKAGALDFFNSVGVWHRTPGGVSGWAGRGNLLWKTEKGTLNLGIQQNTHLFNSWIKSFKKIN